MILKKEFKNNPYPSYVHRRSLAEKLDLPEKTIYYWFQNKRKMEKRLGRTNYRATDMPRESLNYSFYIHVHSNNICRFHLTSYRSGYEY